MPNIGEGRAPILHIEAVLTFYDLLLPRLFFGFPHVIQGPFQCSLLGKHYYSGTPSLEDRYGFHKHVSHKAFVPFEAKVQDKLLRCFC